MAKITRITTQKKSKNRYNIYLDRGQGEAYGFSVDEDILIEYTLQKDKELEESTIEALIQKDTVHKVYTQTINYLSYRMRSEKEIRDFLLKKETDDEHIEEIIRRLYREKLLDDLEFAKALVRTRMNTATKGPLMLKKELIEKGVDASLADEAIMEFPFALQVEKAAKLAEKKVRSDRKKSQKQQIQNAQQHLMQKGFNSDVIKEALSSLPEEEDNQEWEAVVFQGEKLLRKYERKSEGYELKQKVKSGLYRKGFTFEEIDRFIDEYVTE
ncbi:recombination regulator RecX [Halobacillus sp. A5]|uniref:recombination regulator RecX n=1 Tax=Halobacillus sp. A5 TaxID=2880263 RepID=UPI0020A69196|nr:recombination regulator RecX [Halobacillus sp. A5]MCP3028856.1 recombination regulator RecX [Halobacillus sp. A5]